MKINISEIPEHGLKLDGKESKDILSIDEKDVLCISDISYSLTVKKRGNQAISLGELQSDFKLTCVRCMEPINFTAKVDNFRNISSIEDSDEIDLTQSIRDELLFKLPAYPKCETQCVSFPDADDLSF